MEAVPLRLASATIVDLRRRLKLWRTAAIAASAIAASLVVAVGVRDFQPKPKQQNLVAVLQKDAASPAFLVTVNIEDRIMTVQPVAAKPEPGKSYELWIVQDSLGAPKSLGRHRRTKGDDAANARSLQARRDRKCDVCGEPRTRRRVANGSSQPARSFFRAS